LTGRTEKSSYRLNRFLARAGIASRRKSDELIARGQVAVNGVIVTGPGTRVTEDDKVLFQGERVRLPALKTAVLNKPLGYETTLANGSERSITSLMEGLVAGTVPVGRLDINTGGLLLLSNDGELVNRLMHPRWMVDREYRIFTAVETLNRRDLARLKKGAYIGPGEYSRPLALKQGRNHVDIVIRTGRNREVRRLFKACGIQLKGLERIRYGPVTLGGLQRGEYRLLEGDELHRLRQAVGLS